MFTLLDLCVSSLRMGHASLLCIVPILTDDPRRESYQWANVLLLDVAEVETSNISWAGPIFPDRTFENWA